MDNNATINDGINAVSVYGQTDGMDDFPVLKAFQQYIDAEQAKARKRMVMLSVFFGFMIAVIIAVFAVMIHSVSERNQMLNDRLVEYVMKERDRQAESAAQAAASAPSANEMTLRAMTDSLVAIQKELAEKKETAVRVPSPQEIARQKQLQSEQDALDSQRALLDAEKKTLAEEREKLRQQEIEMHRRKLYPEYYQGKDAAATTKHQTTPQATTRTKRMPTLSQSDIDEILAEVNDIYEEELAAEKPVATPTKTATTKSAAKATPVEIDDDDAIEYFNDDEYSLPVEIKGTSTGWKIPLK